MNKVARDTHIDQTIKVAIAESRVAFSEDLRKQLGELRGELRSDVDARILAIRTDMDRSFTQAKSENLAAAKVVDEKIEGVISSTNVAWLETNKHVERHCQVMEGKGTDGTGLKGKVEVWESWHGENKELPEMVKRHDDRLKMMFICIGLVAAPAFGALGIAIVKMWAKAG